ncbi:MAG: hypothetical protein EON48_09295 [Acetobacteraceae bacterium]|nr:MAG: hypothetical protein EON48_09295 [Acetobacteraceae bacterium]
MPLVEIAESDEIVISQQPCPGYRDGEDSAGETVRNPRQGISEADLRKVVMDANSPARILRVVVVEVATTADLAPYLVLSDRAGWHPLALRRHEGVKAWGDLRTLRKVLAGFGYSGRLHVIPQGDPLLARLGID